MAEDNDDQWLYGESEEATDGKESSSATVTSNETSEVNSEKPSDTEGENVVLQPPVIAAPKKIDSSEKQSHELQESSEVEQSQHSGDDHTLESGEVTDKQDESKLEEGEMKDKGSDADEDEDDDDDDDNVNVVIGDLRTTPGYGTGLHIKRGNLLQLTKQPGKFSVEDFDSVGTINGVAAHEYNLDVLEDKPWRKPGADITDYFNYGFNEDTWRAYCERQKRIRVNESGVGLIPMTQTLGMMNPIHHIPQVKQLIPDPSMMPPGGMGIMPNRRQNDIQKENIIQVMTADRREYSRKNFTPDMSVPPPMIPPFPNMPPGPMQPPFVGNPYGHPPPMGDYYGPPAMDPYYSQSYEPVQESQWAGPDWNGPNIPLGANGHPGMMDRPRSRSNDLSDVKIKIEPEDDEADSYRERDRGRGRSREYDRERDHERRKERSHRHRSRSRSHERRSRKHKSRSRSPSHRSHKKKKSKKSDRHSKEGSTD